MATTAISVVSLALNTESADLLAAGTVATTPGDGWVIAADGKADRALCLIFEADATGDTVTIVAGDRPPSQRAGLGNETVTLAASDIRAIWIDGSRFTQDDGSILATCTDAGTRCYAISPAFA